MKRILSILTTLLAFASSAFATHNKAGEITYKCLGGFTYEITVTTYTNTNNTTADRCELTVYFGDGDSAIFVRENGSGGSCPSPAMMGENVIGFPFTKYNRYRGTHTYNGPGSYNITMEDPNRNAGIDNIPSSVNVPFFIRTTLVINTFVGCNSSPVLLNPPLDLGCANKCYYHNPGAFDPDGDSLSYAFGTCLTAGGKQITGYTLPPTGPPNILKIDPATGDVTWCVPPKPGKFNLAIFITQWKKWGNTYINMGVVERDMQIDILDNCTNTPPVLEVRDTCVDAGTLLNLTVKATDVDTLDKITITASGGPFTNVNLPLATFLSTISKSPATGTMTWQTSCAHIRKQPYYVSFKAKDDNINIPLVDFKTIGITIIAPAPLNFTAKAQCTSMILNWDKALCNPSNNPVVQYNIYRKVGCDAWVPGKCEPGVPGNLGYTLIKTVIGYNNNTYTDDNGGAGLVHGVDYSYHVTAVYKDGAESYASLEVCAKLVRDVPIITNVSVTSTSATTGTMDIKWLKPLATAGNLDTIANPGPYEFRLYRSSGFFNASTQIGSFTSPFFGTLNTVSYADNSLNTQDSPYVYRIEFYSNNNRICKTKDASSVYLSIAPADNKLKLTWEEHVPWTNIMYYIYKETFAGSTVFVLLDSTTAQTYTDDSLKNGATYCYYIMSKGQYPDVSLPRPLINLSEVKCGVPVDIEPPCQPSFYVGTDCIITENTLVWNNPNHSCADDVVKFNVYFSPTTNGDLSLIYTTTNLNDTVLKHNLTDPLSVAGCYAVTAVDSFGNESPIVSKICVDNCPEYILPNVFSPDGDGTNEFFIPLLPYRYIKDVDITIYDRWGLVMFHTTDPMVLWDGKNQDTKKRCPDGVYYYVCTVNEIRVAGITPRVLKGFVHVFNGKEAKGGN